MQVNGLVEAPSSPKPVKLDKPKDTAASKTAAAHGSPSTEHASPVDDEALKKLVEETNRALAGHRSELQFVVEGKPKQLVVKLIDTESKQVLRQFPTEEMMAVARNLDRLKSLTTQAIA